MGDEVQVKHGRIEVGDCLECGGIECTPEEARDLASRLLTAANQAEANIAAILAACAEGHDWGSYMNSWHPWPTTKVTTRYCKRDGCDGRIEEPGWVEFAGRLHFDFTGRQASCYGPGCEQCDNEKVGQAMRAIIREASAALDAVLGGGQ